MMKIFSVRDIKAETFGPLMVCSAPVEAYRAVSIVLETGNSTIARYPEDYHVFSLGTFDPGTGRISVFDSPHFEFAVDSVYRDLLDRRQQRGAAVGGANPPQDKPQADEHPEVETFPDNGRTPELL